MYCENLKLSIVYDVIVYDVTLVFQTHNVQRFSGLQRFSGAILPSMKAKKEHTCFPNTYIYLKSEADVKWD